MGVVIRQSIITSIIAYVGVVIGYINLAYLFPKFLNLEQVGLLRTVQDFAMLIVPFSQFGLAQSLIRFYPSFAAEKKQGNFISLIFLLSIISFGLFLIVFFIFQENILSYFSAKAGDVIGYINIILFFAFALQVFGILEQYSRSLLKIAIPNFLREVVSRLLQSILVSLYFLNVINFHQLILSSMLIYVVCLLILLIYLLKIQPLKFELDFDFFKQARTKEIIKFSTLSFVGVSAMIVVAKMDSLMVTAMLGLTANAIYTQAFYIATVIEIPKRAITQTAATIISRAFTTNDIEQIDRIYKKTALNQFIIGSLLLIGIWANVDNIFSLMPKGDVFQSGAMVVIIIGSGKLLDMLFGPSSEIIGLSKYYTFNLVLITVLALIVVGCNQLLIPRYGVNGAAYGTLIALFFYNAIKCIYIWMYLKIQPFTGATLKVVVISGSTVVLNWLIPSLHHVFTDILIRSAAITLWFGAWIIATNCSDEINSLYYKTIAFVFKRR
jgi:O-antigen/teichoic acid export membrane protein